MRTAIIIALLTLTACTNNVHPVAHSGTEDTRICGGTWTPSLVGAAVGFGIIGGVVGYHVGEYRAGNCIKEYGKRGYTPSELHPQKY